MRPATRNTPEPVLPWQTDERGRPVVKIGHDVWYRIVFVEADGKKCPESRNRWHYEIECKMKDRPWYTIMQASAAVRGNRPRMYYSEHAAKLAVEDLPFPRSRR